MKAYKGFSPDLTCRGFQYAEGGEYTHDGPVELCASGFHACPMPLDVLRYYPVATSVFHEVEVDDVAQGDGDKVVSRTLRVGAKIAIAGMIEAHLNLVWDRVRRAAPKRQTSGDGSTAATSGDGSTAATSGDRATAATSGDYSTAATSGYHSVAATSGYHSVAATSGDYSTAATSGDESIAVAGGHKCRARGAVGCWLVLAERDQDGRILDVKAVHVDGDTIRADTPYMLLGGQVVAVKS